MLPEEVTEAQEEPDHTGATDQNAEVIAPVSSLTVVPLHSKL